MRGHGGYCPDYYNVIRAARYLGVSPWDLEEQPIYWIERAFVCDAAEKSAEAFLKSRNRHR